MCMLCIILGKYKIWFLDYQTTLELVSRLPVWSPFPFPTSYHLSCSSPQASPPPHGPFILVSVTLHVVHSHLKIGVGTTGEREQAAQCVSFWIWVTSLKIFSRSNRFPASLVERGWLLPVWDLNKNRLEI